jgi:hypothetical protein
VKNAQARLRLDAKDEGIVFYHGDGPDQCDYLGTQHTTPAPDFIPAFPYLTMKGESDSPLGPWRKQYGVTPFKVKANSYYSGSASPGFIVKNANEYLMYFSASTDNLILRTISLAWLQLPLTIPGNK